MTNRISNALFHAIMSHNADALQHVLDESDGNPDCEGYTAALYASIRFGYQDLALMLISDPATHIDQPCPGIKENPLFIASLMGKSNVKISQVVGQAMAALYQRFCACLTPVHLAAAYGQTEVLQLMLEKYPHLLNMPCSLPEAMACKLCHGEVLFTPLISAVVKGQYPTVQLLLNLGGSSQNDALIISVSKRDQDMVVMLVEHGVVPPPDAIYLAAHRGDLKMMEILHTHGGRVEEMYDNYDTMDRNRINLIGYLLIEGLQFNHDTRNSGAMATHTRQPTEYIQRLIALGANSSQINDSAISPVFRAVCGHSYSVLLMLLSAGAKMDSDESDRCLILVLGCDIWRMGLVQLVCYGALEVTTLDAVLVSINEDARCLKILKILLEAQCAVTQRHLRSLKQLQPQVFRRHCFSELAKQLNERSRNVHPLQHFCRRAIRMSMLQRSGNVLGIDELTYPKILKSYLFMAEMREHLN